MISTMNTTGSSTTTAPQPQPQQQQQPPPPPPPPPPTSPPTPAPPLQSTMIASATTTAAAAAGATATTTTATTTTSLAQCGNSDDDDEEEEASRREDDDAHDSSKLGAPSLLEPVDMLPSSSSAPLVAGATASAPVAPTRPKLALASPVEDERPRTKSMVCGVGGRRKPQLDTAAMPPKCDNHSGSSGQNSNEEPEKKWLAEPETASLVSVAGAADRADSSSASSSASSSSSTSTSSGGGSTSADSVGESSEGSDGAIGCMELKLERAAAAAAAAIAVAATMNQDERGQQAASQKHLPPTPTKTNAAISEADTLTSILAHVDKVKRELDQLERLSTLSTVNQHSVANSDGVQVQTIGYHQQQQQQQQFSQMQQQYHHHQCESIQSHEMPLNAYLSPGLLTDVTPRASSDTESTTASLTSQQSRSCEEEDDSSEDQMSGSGSGSGGSAVDRLSGHHHQLPKLGTMGGQSSSSSSSSSPPETLISSPVQKSHHQQQQHHHNHHQNNTLLILQHLIQRRNELKSIDLQLFNIMTQYLLQLSPAADLSQSPLPHSLARSPPSPPPPPHHQRRQECRACPPAVVHQPSPFWCSEPTCTGGGGCGGGPFDGQHRHRAVALFDHDVSQLADDNNVIDLSLDLTSGGGADSTGTTSRAAAALPGGAMSASAACTTASQPTVQTAVEAAAAAAAEVGARRSLSVNPKKSRLLGANLSGAWTGSESPHQHQQQKQQYHQLTPRTASTLYQSPSTRAHYHSSHSQTSPLNLLKSFRTPPSTTMQSTTTSSSAQQQRQTSSLLTASGATVNEMTRRAEEYRRLDPEMGSPLVAPITTPVGQQLLQQQSQKQTTALVLSVASPSARTTTTTTGDIVVVPAGHVAAIGPNCSGTGGPVELLPQHKKFRYARLQNGGGSCGGLSNELDPGGGGRHTVTITPAGGGTQLTGPHGTLELIRATIGKDCHQLVSTVAAAAATAAATAVADAATTAANSGGVAQQQQQRMAFRCHVCGSGFEDRHRLQQHLSIHLDLHPSWFEEKTIKETMAQYESKRGDYLCAGCNLRFETTAEFDKHMQLHGDKPHRCELCNQDNKMVCFRYYRQLLTHLRSHCFLYSCRFAPDCKQTANRKDYLKLHILKHHLNNKLPEQFTICCH